MRILLDTNAYSDLKKGTRWVREVATAAEVWMSVTVLGELRFGFGLGKRKAKNLRELEEFLEDPAVNPAVIGDATATLYGDLKRYLRAKGTPIPENDIWIAASCVEHGALLLTADRHFEKLPQVQVIRPED